jgi:hypothetical protein
MEGKEKESKDRKESSIGTAINDEAVRNCDTSGAPSQCNNGNAAERDAGDCSDTESWEETFIDQCYGRNALVSMRQSITSLRHSIRSSITKTTSIFLAANTQNRDADFRMTDDKSVLDRSTAQIETSKSQSLIDPLESEAKDNIFFPKTLHPYSIGRALWDLFIVASFLLRFPVTWNIPVFTKVGAIVAPALNGAVKVAFLVDIFSNLITAYYDNKSLKLVSNQRSIAIRYLSRYIFGDAIIVFFKYNNVGFGSHIATILILGFVQLTRIIRA